MSVRTIKGNRLFWKITAVFTGLLIVLGVVFVIIASNFSRSYYTAAHQELYGDIAQHLATFTQPFKNGKPDTTVTHDIIHSTMVANPSVEVYLLDTAGNIKDYVVPDKTVQIHQVNITKVKQWLTADKMKRPMGDNPKQPGEPSIFSAAPVYEKGRLVGYVYAVLASEKQKAILQSLDNNLYLRLASYMFYAALAVAFIVGVVTFFLITDSICHIAAVVKRFKEGDYTARIEGYAQGNLGMLTSTFNEMADVIVDNIDKISATDKFRQELIANVSHDLRTPLSIMQGYVETLMMKKDELAAADREKYLAIVYDSNRKLSVLVEQLFQYAKLEANLITPEKEAFLIAELAADIMMAYQLKADEKNIKLNIQAPDNLPLVFADISLTERVLQNLLDNAFKFTPAGGSITILLRETNAGVKVAVTDTGVGISPEDLTHIFERYKQIHPRSPESKGMGIGLAIVKKILELHQAVIVVTSEPGKGTTFNFELQTI
ncbi:two-component sensor histidine kinase [Niastella koreensis]|uniref:histidine kinase n=2 Tax=Niastella koreensis TaxID=354356 RepID=G8TBT7_NIAKG|nr:HAMP domain-containing sensor histidine kinase [Niastella koreensis]AEV98219.1 integral membrane sensor signal transduction histidine kinase [Niastella koreensis GR20-10]OQP44328.1 two-component sensor histidine kinase [Niastella koreensis]